MFSIEKRVYFCDTDAEGVVYHSKYLDFCEQARTEFMIVKQLSAKEVFSKYGIQYVIRKCELEYKMPARFEDIVLITIDNIELHGLTTTFTQSIIKKSTNDLLAKVKIECVCVDKNFKLIRRLPEELINNMSL